MAHLYQRVMEDNRQLPRQKPCPHIVFEDVLVLVSSLHVCILLLSGRARAIWLIHYNEASRGVWYGQNSVEGWLPD